MRFASSRSREVRGHVVAVVVGAAIWCSCGCRKGPDEGGAEAAAEPAPPGRSSAEEDRAAAADPAGGSSPETGAEPASRSPAEEDVMRLWSLDFEPGGPIPRVHAYRPEGDNRPPRLAWSGLPAGTVELALVVDDPDAPRSKPWVHDVLYNIPVDANPESMVLRGALVDSAARFLPGLNDWNRAEWGGPFPPPGRPHRYFFRLYALDCALSLQPNLTKEQLLEAMEGHVLGTAELMGTYQR
jgi:hypothetical protein